VDGGGREEETRDVTHLLSDAPNTSQAEDSSDLLYFFDQLFINPGFTRGHPRAMNLVWSETLKSGVKKNRA
jgi:hypothetical protein